MTTGHFITNFDFSVLDFIFENIRCDFLDPVMWGLSMFAENGIGWIVLGAILIIPKKTRVWGIMALFAIAVGFITGEIVTKNIFCRVRPFHVYQLFHNNTPLPFELNAGPASGQIAAYRRQSPTGILDQGAYHQIGSHLRRLYRFHEFTVTVIHHTNDIRFDRLDKTNQFSDPGH